MHAPHTCVHAHTRTHTETRGGAGARHRGAGPGPETHAACQPRARRPAPRRRGARCTPRSGSLPGPELPPPGPASCLLAPFRTGHAASFPKASCPRVLGPRAPGPSAAAQSLRNRGVPVCPCPQRPGCLACRSQRVCTCSPSPWPSVRPPHPCGFCPGVHVSVCPCPCACGSRRRRGVHAGTELAVGRQTGGRRPDRLTAGPSPRSLVQVC